MRVLQKLWPASRSARTDGVVFRLFYRITVPMLVVFSFVITCRLLFGFSFVCTSMDREFTNEINTYCYTHGPFIVLSAMAKNIAHEVLYPGIPHELKSSDERVHAPYYPWVNLFLLVLAILFYLPHLVWKVYEGGLMTRLTTKVNDSSVSEAERKSAIVEIARYIVTTRGGHLGYTGIYVLSEILNWLVGVLLTVWLVNFFKADMYFRSLDFNVETWDDFFAYNFPFMGLCTYKRYGASGDIQQHKILCYLPLNNLYGYMFLFLYAWFIMLCVFQALVIPYRVFGLILPPIRLLLFRLRSGVADQRLLNFINTAFSLGDWFLLTRLQKNLLSHDLTKLLIYVQENINKSPIDMEMDDLAKLG